MFFRRTSSPYTFDFAADCRSISASARHPARHFAQRTMQWPQGARFVRVAVGLGEVGLPHVLDQHTPAVSISSAG
jgi:hypothetical protein